MRQEERYRLERLYPCGGWERVLVEDLSKRGKRVAERVGFRRVYRLLVCGALVFVVREDGGEMRRVCRGQCDCPAGGFGRLCVHRRAVERVA